MAHARVMVAPDQEDKEVEPVTDSNQEDGIISKASAVVGGAMAEMGEGVAGVSAAVVGEAVGEVENRVVRTGLSTALSYFDLISDLLLGWEFVDSDDASIRSTGYVVLGIVGFALLVQAYLCLAMGSDITGWDIARHRWMEAGATLVGLKPGLDMWRVRSATDLAALDKAKFGQSTYRVIEGTLETFPETVVQVQALLRMLLAGQAVSLLQSVSLVASIVTFGFMLAAVNMDTDESVMRRAALPWQGYYPPEGLRKLALFASETAFHCGFFAGKVLALAVLAEAWPVALGAWAAGEAVAFLALLATVGQRWTAPVRHTDMPVLNAVVNTLAYLVLLVAPITFFRDPQAATPHVWFGWIVWTTLGANWAMTGLALMEGRDTTAAAASNATLVVGVFDDAGEQALMWAAGTCTLVTVVGAVCALALMEPEKRDTFWRRRTYKQMVVEDYWEQWDTDLAEWLKGDFGFTNPSRVTRRFLCILGIPRCYCPEDAVVEAFVREHFRRFVEDEFEGELLVHLETTKSAKEFSFFRDLWEEVLALEFVSPGVVAEADARAWIARNAERWNHDRPKWFVKWRSGKAGGVPDALRDVLARPQCTTQARG